MICGLDRHVPIYFTKEIIISLHPNEIISSRYEPRAEVWEIFITVQSAWKTSCLFSLSNLFKGDNVTVECWVKLPEWSLQVQCLYMCLKSSVPSVHRKCKSIIVCSVHTYFQSIWLMTSELLNLKDTELSVIQQGLCRLLIKLKNTCQIFTSALWWMLFSHSIFVNVTFEMTILKTATLW